MKVLRIARDVNGIATYATEISDTCFQMLTVIGNQYSVEIPVNGRLILFSATDHFFVSGAAFVLPIAGVWSNQKIALSPQGIIIDDETHIYIQSRTVVDLNMSFYAVPV